MDQLTLRERAGFYAQEFPRFSPMFTDRERWLYGIWVMGQYWKGSGYYGAYPPSYLARLGALFPDAKRVLHLFSGSLSADSCAPLYGVRMDCQWKPPQVQPSLLARAPEFPFLPGSFDFAAVDPPYSHEDAKRYGTPMVGSLKVFNALYDVVEPGGVVAWLDTSRPQYRRAQWHWFGVINVVRSSNHRVRDVFLFERQPSDRPAFLLGRALDGE